MQKLKILLLAVLVLVLASTSTSRADALGLGSASHPAEAPVLRHEDENQPPEAISDEADEAKVVYLTFDDGPDPNWTPLILQILDRYHAGATFYMIGRNANSHPELTRMIAEHNQTIAVHGYNHLDLAHVDFQTFYLEVNDTAEAILESLKEEPNLESQYGKCLRPPYGSTSEYLYRNASEMDYAVSMWNIDTKDWQQLDPEEILNNVLKGLEPGKVILMHNGGQEREKTVLGLQLVLHELIMRGYEVLPYCKNEGQAIQNP